MKTIRHLSTAACLAACPFLGGCFLPPLIGGLNQNFEYQKQIEVLPKYSGLEGKRVAVVVNADLDLLYQHPELTGKVTAGVTLRLRRELPDVRFKHPDHVVDWQWRTRQWNAMSHGEMCESLQVDRIVFIDIHAYRLNPPGNRWLWEGECAARVSIIEADGFDPDMFADTFDVMATFPSVSNVEVTSASANQIEFGLLHEFIKHTSWLFYKHLEPKYPDKFRPELAAS